VSASLSPDRSRTKFCGSCSIANTEIGCATASENEPADPFSGDIGRGAVAWHPSARLIRCLFEGIAVSYLAGRMTCRDLSSMDGKEEHDAQKEPTFGAEIG
jgi:hypothetical protein